MLLYLLMLFEQDSVTLRNQINPRVIAKLLNPGHLYDDLGDDVKEMVRSCRVPSFTQGIPSAAKNYYHGAREEKTNFTNVPGTRHAKKKRFIVQRCFCC